MWVAYIIIIIITRQFGLEVRYAKARLIQSLLIREKAGLVMTRGDGETMSWNIIMTPNDKVIRHDAIFIALHSTLWPEKFYRYNFYLLVSSLNCYINLKFPSIPRFVYYKQWGLRTFMFWSLSEFFSRVRKFCGLLWKLFNTLRQFYTVLYIPKGWISCYDFNRTIANLVLTDTKLHQYNYTQLHFHIYK